MEGFEFHVHGLWFLGGIFFLIAAMIAGNVEYVLGTTDFSYLFSVALAFILFLIAGLFWISAAANARVEMH